MSNYYKQFEKLIRAEHMKGKKLTLDDFKNKLMINFGFGGRNKSINRWIHNFKNVGYIDLVKENDESFVVIK